jgi:hypothetical protein
LATCGYFRIAVMIDNVWFCLSDLWSEGDMLSRLSKQAETRIFLRAAAFGVVDSDVKRSKISSTAFTLHTLKGVQHISIPCYSYDPFKTSTLK